MIKLRRSRCLVLTVVVLALLPGWGALAGWATLPEWLAVLAIIYTSTITGTLCLVAAAALLLGIVYWINWEYEYQRELKQATRSHRREALRKQQARGAA